MVPFGETNHELVSFAHLRFIAQKFEQEQLLAQAVDSISAKNGQFTQAIKDRLSP